jgi:uroporphyrin-3 C-methyltransferase
MSTVTDDTAAEAEAIAARIALLGHDDATFKADLAAADDWVKQYFDTRAKPVQALQANLKQLAATPMGAAVPDLARSLEALRTLRLAQDRPAGRAADRPVPAR